MWLIVTEEWPGYRGKKISVLADRWATLVLTLDINECEYEYEYEYEWFK